MKFASRFLSLSNHFSWKFQKTACPGHGKFLFKPVRLLKGLFLNPNLKRKQCECVMLNMGRQDNFECRTHTFFTTDLHDPSHVIYDAVTD